MENIHVILCGSDAYQVESALQGIAEKEDYAWNKKYRFSCTNALSIDRVDSRLLLVCHIIVLCKGCRPPKDRELYTGRPVLSLPDASSACVEDVRDLEFYYGPTTLAELREAVVSIALAPSHVVYDSLLQCLTPQGEAAYQRAFWLLDKNNDGHLDTEELLTWARLTRAADFSAESLTEFLGSVVDVVGACPGCRLSRAQFLQLHQHWLEVGDTESAWATLHAAGTHPTGLPYSWYDLHSMRIDRDVNTYLSPHAIQFFRNVYKLKRFKDADAAEGGIWHFTPGCPWAHVDGFSAAGTIVLDRFIEYWKYMALERRDAVIMYARYWGYKGDTNFLFVQRAARASRDAAEPLPNTLQVLVVGTAGCGRKSLIYELTAGSKEKFQPRQDAPLYVRTTTFYAEKVGGSGGSHEELQTIVLTTIAPDKAELIMTNESLNKTFDIVLLCVDGSNCAKSAAYAMELYTRSKESGACVRLPFLLVMTKSDCLDASARFECGPPASSVTLSVMSRLPPSLLPLSVALRLPPPPASLRTFAEANRLLWPPVMVSVARPEESEMGALNEYMYTVARTPELALGKAPLTWVKLLRRGTFTAILAVGALRTIQKVGQWILSRRRSSSGSSSSE